MPLPNYRYFIPAAFAALKARSAPTQRRDLVEEAASQFGVTPEQRREVIPSGRQLVYANRIGFALNALKNAGLAETVAWGVWQLSSRGRSLADKYPTGLTDEVAREIDRTSRGLESIEPSEVLGSPDDESALSNADPATRALDAIRQNRSETADALLKEMQLLQPEQFELLALQVLQKAGYGHESVNFEHKGRSGDGGIDGWLPLDRLGLQKVYVQAKRYKESNSVSAGHVRDFAGAMLAHNANLGVFVTLSRYTEDARLAASNVRDRTIELVDGMRLAQLMIEVGVGVSHEPLPPIAKLDTDFFEDI